MDDSLYTTSFSLYSLGLPTPPRLLSLLSSDDATLQAHSKELFDSLVSTSRRPVYEAEEERARLGSLGSCEIQLFQQQRQGVVITISYDRVTYKSIFYATTTTNNSDNDTPTTTSPGPRQKRRKTTQSSSSASSTSVPLVLIKANQSLTKRLFAFFTEYFGLASDPTPLKLRPSLLLSGVQKYIVSLRTSFNPVEERESILSLLRDIIGILRITITVNSGAAVSSVIGGAAAIARNLRSIDIGIDSETLYQLLEQSIPDPPGPQSRRRGRMPKISFLPSLQHHIHERTGLILPIVTYNTEYQQRKQRRQKQKQKKRDGNTEKDNNDVDDDLSDDDYGDEEEEEARALLEADDAPLRVTRVQSTAFAIGMEGRLKFSTKPVEMMDAVPGLTSADENVVRAANRDLLTLIVTQATTNAR